MIKTVSLGIVVILAVTAGILLVNKRTRKTLPMNSAKVSSSAIRYLPLGDSYTIGQSVPNNQRWPDQLVARLRTDGIDITISANPSVTGYTTQDLIKKELPYIDNYKPNFVTVLIGVNDYVQGIPASVTTKNLKLILDTVQKTVHKERIILVTIPDYAKTPTGARFGDPEASSVAIKSLNDIIINEATQRRLLAIDIYTISQMVSSDTELIATDGLHPSGKQYSLWTDAVYQSIKANKIFSDK